MYSGELQESSENFFVVFTGAEYNRLLNYNDFVRGCDEGGSYGDGGGGAVEVKFWTFKGGEGATIIEQVQARGMGVQIFSILW